MSERIAYPDNPIMAAAWFGCVMWVASVPEAIARFEAETGHRWLPGSVRSGIERMIDKATGHEAAVFDAFVDWVNINVWGEDPFMAHGTRGEETPRGVDDDSPLAQEPA